MNQTAHKQAQDALFEAEKKYRDIFENAGEGIFQSTPDGRFIAANPALARMHGFESPEELINSCKDITCQIYADSPRREEFKRLLKENGVVRGFEHQVFRKDQSKIWITVNARVVRNELGEIVYYEGTAQDITERKRAEDDLIKQKEILEKIFNHIPVMINFTGSDGRIKLVNREWEQTLGWSQEEALNEELDVLSQCYPDLEYRREVLEFIAAADGEWRDFKTRVSDGSQIDTSWYRTKLSDGTTIGIGQNITQRKNAEESLKIFRNLIDRSTDAIEVLDPDTLQFLDCNATAHQSLGYTREEFLSLSAFDIDAVLDQPMAAQLVEEMDKSGFVIFESVHRRKDGSTFPVEINAKTIRLERDYRLAVVQKITERKRAETRSAAFANLAQKLSGAMTPLDAGQIIVQTAYDLFGWGSCTLDLYDAERDVIHRILNVDTIGGDQVPVTRFSSAQKPTSTGRRVIDRGAEIILRREPLVFDKDAVAGGDAARSSAATMTAPIRHASRVIGILSIESYSPTVYDDVAMGDLQALADHCGEALNRIQAEEQLRESEERCRDLIENSRDLICTHDLDGLILSANRAAIEVLGHNQEDYFGKKNLREILTPEALEGFDDYLTRIRTDGVASGIMLVQTSSGEQRIWEYYNTLRTEGVRAPVVRGMARDITEARRAEEALRESGERYRELFENAKDAIYVHDLNGICTSINRAAEQLTGYSREEIVGRHFSDFLAPEYLSRVREQLGKNLTDQRPTSYEVEITARDGRRVPVELSSNLIFQDGIPVGFQRIARDITEQKRAEELLQTFPRRLIEAQEAERKRIARELHDEIGQVLTAVTLNLQALRASGMAPISLPKIDESILVVEDALHHVRNLSLELRPSLLDDLGLAAAIRWFVDRYSLRTGIKTEIATDAPIAEGRLSKELETACFRIVQEGMTNVARHADAKNVSVHLSALNDGVCISVKDDGIGFNASVRNGSATPLHLGLRGMEERALALGGRLEIKSVPAQGTEIRAYIPSKHKED